MAYKVFWKVPQQVLSVELEGSLSLGDFHQINQAVNDCLDSSLVKGGISILVDITRPGSTPRDFAQLKDSQTYATRRDLRFIMIAGTDKFMRLMTLLTFNLCRPSLRFFNDVDHALTFAQIMCQDWTRKSPK